MVFCFYLMQSATPKPTLFTAPLAGRPGVFYSAFDQKASACQHA
jgi:hypothetical protein